MSDAERYQRAVHAMQTGVAMVMANEPKIVDPKHLRVGINSALCDSTAVAKLLLAKGVFTQEEYAKAIADEMELEVERFRDRIERTIGIRPTLI